MELNPGVQQDLEIVPVCRSRSESGSLGEDSTKVEGQQDGAVVRGMVKEGGGRGLDRP